MEAYVFQFDAACEFAEFRFYVGKFPIHVGHGVVCGEKAQHIEEARLKRFGVAVGGDIYFCSCAKVRYRFGIVAF